MIFLALLTYLHYFTLFELIVLYDLFNYENYRIYFHSTDFMKLYVVIGYISIEFNFLE